MESIENFASRPRPRGDPLKSPKRLPCAKSGVRKGALREQGGLRRCGRRAPLRMRRGAAAGGGRAVSMGAWSRRAECAVARGRASRMHGGLGRYGQGALLQADGRCRGRVPPLWRGKEVDHVGQRGAAVGAWGPSPLRAERAPQVHGGFAMSGRGAPPRVYGSLAVADKRMPLQACARTRAPPRPQHRSNARTLGSSFQLSPRSSRSLLFSSTHDVDLLSRTPRHLATLAASLLRPSALYISEEVTAKTFHPSDSRSLMRRLSRWAS